jgi:hypothetical protein
MLPTSPDPRDRWIADELRPGGERVLSATEVRRSPTGYVLAVQTDRRRVYFKACGDLFAHEPRLCAALAARFPGSVPDVIALDDAQHWILLDDAGPTLRATIRESGQRGLSESMVRAFAALQRETAAIVPDLLALGVPDRRLETLPALFEDLIADAPALMIGHPDGMTDSDADRLRACGPALRDLCARTAAFGLPVTLQHDDFHSANTSLHGDRFAFYDWGESFVAHPFGSLLIALRDAKYLLDYDEDDLIRVRHAYLDGWSGYGSRAELIELLGLTHRLAALGRALTWWSVLRAGDDAYRAENGDAVPYWLLTFLNDTPME